MSNSIPPEHWRKHPIFGTDFGKDGERPPAEIVEEIRSKLSNLRGQLNDVGMGYPGWEERVEPAQGALTCVISLLYDVKQEMVALRGPQCPKCATSRFVVRSSANGKYFCEVCMIEVK